MTTAALCSVISPRVPEAHGMLSCLGGFTPRVPDSARSSGGTAAPHWSQNNVDHDLMHLEHNPDLATKIMRKRQQERDRNSNRLTPRMQRIGLDIAAIDKQVVEKQAVAEVQRGVDERYLDGMLLKGEIIGEIEQMLESDKRRKHKECVDYSFANLGKHQRREWDLSDPHQIKKDKPARIEGFKSAISSMQKFEGEEAVSGEVMKEKRRSQIQCLMAQVAEKKLKAELIKNEDRRRDADLLQANDLRVACELAQKQEAQAEVMENAQANVVIASARTARRLAAREQEAAAIKDHMTNLCEHNLMRERHDYSIGLNGKKRDYKRCSYEEEKAAWDINRELVLAKLGRKRQSEHTDDEYHNIGANLDIIGKEYDEAWNNQNLMRRRQYDAANKAMAQERKERNAIERLEYTSFATPR